MIYGIDLGTTNSLIGYNNTLLSGLVPSIADLEHQVAGASQVKNYDGTIRGFKVDMSMSATGALAREGSYLVLKELKRVAGCEGDIEAVISVPAYFNHSQRQATIKAATKAGIKVIALINEPTAAAIYLNNNKDGNAVIFDLGGGTFDISVIESKGGNHRVLATEGRILGGNDLDRVILEFLASKSEKKWRITDNKYLDIATQAKIAMQKNRKTVKVDVDGVEVDFTPAEYITCMESTFNKAIGLTRNVIEESGVTDYDFYFVGGSTRCPYLQEWVSKELGIVRGFIGYDQDKVVAQGACLYAQLLGEGKAVETVKDVSKLIGIGLSDGLIDVLVPKNTNIPYKCVTTHVADYNNTIESFTLDIYQGDSLIAAECDKIGELSFSFSEPKAPGLSIFELITSIDSNGTVTINCGEILGNKTEVVLEVS